MWPNLVSLSLLIGLSLAIDGLHPPLFFKILFILIITLADRAVERDARLQGRLYAKRPEITRWLSVGLVAIGLILCAAHYRLVGTYSAWNDLATFALSGLFAGTIIRMMLTAYVNGALRISPQSIQRIQLMLVLGVLLVAVPHEPAHLDRTGANILGLGVGFFMHYRIRERQHARVNQLRRAQNMIVAVHQSDERFSRREQMAIEAFSRKDWQKLKLTIDEASEKTIVLALVHVAMLRLQGRYPEAIFHLQQEISKAPRDSKFANLLYWQLALNLGECGRFEEMFDSLELALSLNEACVGVKITLALRLAERISIDEVIQGTPSTLQRECLRHIEEAIQLHESQPPVACLLAKILGSTVPITWTTVMDAQAYVRLKLGQHQSSIFLLNQCVYNDPSFSSPYLHLGEAYLIESRRAPESRRRRSEDSLHLAKVFLHIALNLEGNRDSLIAKRVNQLLKECDSPAAAERASSGPTGTGNTSGIAPAPPSSTRADGTEFGETGVSTDPDASDGVPVPKKASTD